MARGESITCRECNEQATTVVGFAAPMGMPGEDRIVNNNIDVVVLPGFGLKHGFTSVAELPG
jgi:hypothetical protein